MCGYHQSYNPSGTRTIVDINAEQTNDEEESSETDDDEGDAEMSETEAEFRASSFFASSANADFRARSCLSDLASLTLDIRDGHRMVDSDICHLALIGGSLSPRPLSHNYYGTLYPTFKNKEEEMIKPTFENEFWKFQTMPASTDVKAFHTFLSTAFNKKAQELMEQQPENDDMDSKETMEKTKRSFL